MLHDALHDGVGAPDGVLQALEARAEAAHGVPEALVEPARQLVEGVDAGAERVQAPRVRAAPDRGHVDHRELARAEHVQGLKTAAPRAHIFRFSRSNLFRRIMLQGERRWTYLDVVLVERDEVGDEPPRVGVRRRAVPREEGEEVVAAGAEEEQRPRQHGAGRALADARRDVALHGGELRDLLAQRDDGAPLHGQVIRVRARVSALTKFLPVACSDFLVPSGLLSCRECPILQRRSSLQGDL